MDKCSDNGYVAQLLSKWYLFGNGIARPNARFVCDWLLQAIPQISKENGIIICPKTNELFVQPKVEKVYVM